MKTYPIKALALTLGVAVSAVAIAPQSTLAHGKNKNVQEVTVTMDGNGYHPSSINLKAGKPVHMTFVSKGEGCANGVSIPALKKNFHLKSGQKKEVVFTPKKGQTIAFACSMNMFKGKAVVR